MHTIDEEIARRFAEGLTTAVLTWPLADVIALIMELREHVEFDVPTDLSEESFNHLFESQYIGRC